MRVRDVLLEDLMTMGELPYYDKEHNAPAYVVNADGTSILLVSTPPRVVVPMVEGLDADATTLALVKLAAEHSSGGIEWDGGFNPIQSHFNRHRLPFDVILKNPDCPSLVPPHGIQTIKFAGVESDRFYCLTTRERLGRRPTRLGLIAHGVRLPDAVGLLIFNPKGILTVFLDAGPRKFRLHPQA